MTDLTKTMNTMFKEIINNGWKTHKNQNVALYLDVNDVRNAIWTSGNKLIWAHSSVGQSARMACVRSWVRLPLGPPR